MRDEIYPNSFQKIFTWLLYKLPWSKPSITLDSEGIQLFASFPKVERKILWIDIKEIQIYLSRGKGVSNYDIMITLRDPQQYLINKKDKLYQIIIPNMSGDITIYNKFAIPSIPEFKEILKKYPVRAISSSWRDK